jgi:hypothetical protein
MAGKIMCQQIQSLPGRMDRGAPGNANKVSAGGAVRTLTATVQSLKITGDGTVASGLAGKAQPPSPPKKKKSPSNATKRNAANNGEAFFEANGSMQQELHARKEALLKKDGTNSVTLSDISEHQVSVPMLLY